MYVINSHHQVQQVSIESWRDQLYVLFAQDYRDIVNKAYEVATQRIQPQFNAKAIEPLKIQASIVESLKGRIEDLSPYRKHFDQLIEGIDNNKSRFERLPLSQFLHLKFWSTLLASIVHSVAMAVWNLTGSKQKIEEIRKISVTLNPELKVGSVVETKNQPGFEIFVSIKTDSDGEIIPDLDFRIDIGPGKSEVSFSAHRMRSLSNRDIKIESVQDRESSEPITFSSLGVVLDEQNTELDSVYFQLWTAVELMMQEGFDTLFLQGPLNIEISDYGFESGSNVNGCSFWRLTKNEARSESHIVNIKNSKSLTLTNWLHYITHDPKTGLSIERSRLTTEIEQTMRFFPEGPF